MFHGYDEKLAEKLEAIGCNRDDENRSHYWTGTLDDFADKYADKFQVYVTAFGDKRIHVTQHSRFGQR